MRLTDLREGVSCAPHTRTARVLRLVSLAVAIAACSDAEISLKPSGFALGQGRYLLQLAEQGVVLQRDGLPVLSLDPGSFQLGVVPLLGQTSAWDPWDIEQRGEAAAGVTFLSPLSWAPGLDDSGDAVVELDYGRGIGARLTLAVASDARFTLSFAALAPSPGQPRVALARVRVRTSGDPTEGFYGLGAQLDGVDNRGKLRAMQLETDREGESKSESGTNDAHVPVPLVVGTHGWGMFAATQRIGVFDVARKDPAVVEATFSVAGASEDERPAPLRVDLFLADAPLDLYREYYAASSLVRPPPFWSLGPWVWRDTNKNQAEVEDDIAQLRSLDLAISGIWVNHPYERAVNTFDFDITRFPDSLGLVEHAHGAGLRFALWSTPYLEKAAEPYFDEATTRAYFPPKTGTIANPFGPPIDLTSPTAAGYWRGLIQKLTALGVDGFKLDYGEDVVPSLNGQRNVWGFADGSDERTTHYRYPELYHRTYSDAASGRAPDQPVNDNPLPFMFVRSAHWGEQSLGIVLSAGDLDATFTKHGEGFTAREGTVIPAGIGGLPASVAMGLSLAASGYSYFAADTGGYRHSPADNELFMRWVEQAALLPVMEIGDATNQPPWALTPENGRDSDAFGALQAYTRLHARLFPYFWTHAQRQLVDGRPLVRPIGLAYPELGRHPSDEYLVGDDLLVAPVLARGQATRHLIVPPGSWFGYWDAAPLSPDARSEVDVEAPRGTLPLFVREGAIIPLLRPTIDTLAMATDPTVESYERDPGLLWALVAPGPSRSFDLWDGSGIAREAAGSFRVKDGAIFSHGFMLELVGTPAPADVLRDGTAIPPVASVAVLDTVDTGWAWSNSLRGTLLVKLPAGDAHVVVR
jgi:alpha-D-xyloside xylohydrolase